MTPSEAIEELKQIIKEKQQARYTTMNDRFLRPEAKAERVIRYEMSIEALSLALNQLAMKTVPKKGEIK